MSISKRNAAAPSKPRWVRYPSSAHANGHVFLPTDPAKVSHMEQNGHHLTVYLMHNRTYALRMDPDGLDYLRRLESLPDGTETK